MLDSRFKLNERYPVIGFDVLVKYSKGFINRELSPRHYLSFDSHSGRHTEGEINNKEILFRLTGFRLEVDTLLHASSIHILRYQQSFKVDEKFLSD